MRIQLLCDQKWRDLPNLTALKLKLEKLGHRVLMSSTRDSASMINAFRPDCVVLNHLFASSNVALARALKQSDVAVVILPTEGAVRPELLTLSDGEFSDYTVFDRHLAWSEPAAEGIRKRWGLEAEQVPAIGCTRFDFYTPKFQFAITPREEFARQHRLDPNRPIVTWATAYNFADMEEDGRRREQFIREWNDSGVGVGYSRVGVSAERLIWLHGKERRAAVSAFMAVAKKQPDVQFIVRPHPAESRESYRALIADSGLQNIRFCPQDYIWNILNASDLHLHRHCTTAVEAWMWDKPTVEMALDVTEPLFWPDREAGSDIADSTETLEGLVTRYLSGAEIDEPRRQYRRDYIHRWFGPADGKRCAAAAQNIDQLLSERGRSRSYWTSFRDIDASKMQIATACARYFLGKRPNEALLRKSDAAAIDPYDKYIRLPDIRNYESLLGANLPSR